MESKNIVKDLIINVLEEEFNALEKTIKNLKNQKIYDNDVKDEEKNKLDRPFFVYLLDRLTKLCFVREGKNRRELKNVSILETKTRKFQPYTPHDGIEIKYSDAKKIIKFLQEYIEDVDKEFEKKMENDNGTG